MLIGWWSWMARRWVGRGAARDAARQADIVRRRAVVERALQLARQYPAMHLQRWQALEAAAGIDDEVVAEVAGELIGVGEKSSVLLGLQLLDPATLGPGLSRQRREGLCRLVEPYCRADADPELIVMALTAWGECAPQNDRRTAQFIHHPSPTVRARAAYLHATDESVPGRQRLTTLTAVLEQEGDAAVREQAAEGLRLVFLRGHYGLGEDLGADAALASEVVDSLRAHHDDPAPAVRATVFAVLGLADDQPDLEWLLRELADPHVHPGFVSVLGPGHLDNPGTHTTISPLVQLDDAGARTRVRSALTLLRDSGWADRVRDGDYPDRIERAQTLQEAIEAATAPA
jgi:hypothetical protein